MQSYGGVVSFIYLIQLILSLAVSIYLVFALIAPGVFGSLGSTAAAAWRSLDLVYVMLASGYILLATRRSARRPSRPATATEAPAAYHAPGGRHDGGRRTSGLRADHQAPPWSGAGASSRSTRSLHRPVVPERHGVLGPGEAALVLGRVGLPAQSVEQRQAGLAVHPLDVTHEGRVDVEVKFSVAGWVQTTGWRTGGYCSWACRRSSADMVWPRSG